MASLAGAEAPVRREALLWLRAAREDMFDAALMMEGGALVPGSVPSRSRPWRRLSTPVVADREPPRLHRVADLYRGLAEAGWRLPRDTARKLYILQQDS